jgi:hypothetical protein
MVSRSSSAEVRGRKQGRADQGFARRQGALNTLAALTRLNLACALMALGCASTGNAQEAPARPTIEPHRFDEDWRPLCDPALQTAPADRLKCIPLAPATTLTLGGELRKRLEATYNPRFGLSQDRDSVLLHRALVHADLRVGQRARVFVQLGFFDQSGRDGRPAPTDINRLDVTQAFFDFNAPIAAGVGTLRFGRQELSFGSSRLVSVREGPNVRRSFDGGRAFWTGGGYRADAFYVRPVAIEPGTFDDGRVDGEAFWGAYLTGPAPGAEALKIDAYYLGYERVGAVFAVGIEDERRHTLGLRLFGAQDGVDWDIEGAVQVGTFGSQDIRAWTVASDVGYRFENVPLKPRLGMKADVASGDSKPAGWPARHLQRALSEAAIFLRSQPRRAGQHRQFASVTRIRARPGPEGWSRLECFVEVQH